MIKQWAIVVISVFAFMQTVAAEEVARNTLELQSTFQGNQEQPKVMYIVPWQKIQAPAAAYRPLDSLIGANFRYIDRDEFRRGVAYRSAIEELKPKYEEQE